MNEATNNRLGDMEVGDVIRSHVGLPTRWVITGRRDGRVLLVCLEDGRETDASPAMEVYDEELGFLRSFASAKVA